MWSTIHLAPLIQYQNIGNKTNYWVTLKPFDNRQHCDSLVEKEFYRTNLSFPLILNMAAVIKTRHKWMSQNVFNKTTNIL